MVRFGLLMGVVFAVVLTLIWDGLPATYANDSEVKQLKERLGNWAMVIFVLYQPVQSMLGVYSALISASQQFVFWGKITAATFIFIFLPLVLTAAAIKVRCGAVRCGAVRCGAVCRIAAHCITLRCVALRCVLPCPL